jgi:hypothetical protein
LNSATLLREGIDTMLAGDVETGRGVHLAGARFEFTSDLVTPMPQSWPKWLVDEREREFFFLHQNPPPHGSIWTYAFKGR